MENKSTRRISEEMKFKILDYTLNKNQTLINFYSKERIINYLNKFSDEVLIKVYKRGLFETINLDDFLNELGYPNLESGIYGLIVKKHPYLLISYDGFDLFSLEKIKLERLARGDSIEDVLENNIPTKMKIQISLKKDFYSPKKRETRPKGTGTPREMKFKLGGRSGAGIRSHTQYHGKSTDAL